MIRLKIVGFQQEKGDYVMTNLEAKEKLYMEWQKLLENNIDYEGISEAYKMAFKALEQEPKTGHWKAKSFHELFCDNCGFDFDIMRNDFIDKMNYCPNCGAKMVKPQERSGEK